MKEIKTGFGGLPPYRPSGYPNKWDDLRGFIDRLGMDNPDTKFKNQVWGWVEFDDELEKDRAVTTCHSYKMKKGVIEGWRVETRTEELENGGFRLWIHKVKDIS